MKDELDAEARRAQRRADKVLKAVAARDAAVFQSIMSTPGGRAWMEERLEACHVFAPSFATEALVMAFREGERNIGLQLLSGVMVACPEAYILMMQEKSRGGRDDSWNRRDPDDERNWDGDRWIGDGDEPE